MVARGLYIDRGWKRLLRGIRKTAPGLVAKVGIQGTDAEKYREGGITNASLATTHEFGSKAAGVPERSFMRSTFDAKRKEYEKLLERIAKADLDGTKLEGELLLLGEQHRSDIIEKIRSNIPPPLAEVTVERKKGEATALIDTGQLLNSISVVVEKGTGKERRTD